MNTQPKPDRKPRPEAGAAKPAAARALRLRPAKARRLFEPNSQPLDSAVANTVGLRRLKGGHDLAILALLIGALALNCLAQNPANDTNARPATQGSSPVTNTRQAAALEPRASSSSRNPQAQVQARGTNVDFSSFRILSERNIFDPNRSPRRPNNAPRPRPKTVESFSLVGVMAYQKGNFAFFDGSSSQFRKAVKPADTIAGFKVAEVFGNSVKLVSDSKEFTLQVGTQMRREDEGEWQSSKRTEAYGSGGSRGSLSSSTATPPGPTTAAPAATASPGSSAGADEVLRRLMQRREQE